MKKSMVISFIGNDQPGLIRSISDVVGRHHGNWLESKISQLASQFAGIAVVEVDRQHLESLKAAPGNIDGISTLVEET